MVFPICAPCSGAVIYSDLSRLRFLQHLHFLHLHFSCFLPCFLQRFFLLSFSDGVASSAVVSVAATVCVSAATEVSAVVAAGWQAQARSRMETGLLLSSTATKTIVLESTGMICPARSASTSTLTVTEVLPTLTTLL